MVRVIAYNVLAQPLATSKYFPYAHRNALKASVRIPKLIETIQKQSPECLIISEAWADFATVLEKEGYTVDYAQRDNRQYGSILAWKSNSWELISSARGEFNDLTCIRIEESVPCYQACTSSSSAKKNSTSNTTTNTPLEVTDDPAISIEEKARQLYRTDSLCQFVALRRRLSSSSTSSVTSLSSSSSSSLPSGIVLSGAHLYWNPAEDHVKVAQVAMLLQLTGEFYSAYGLPHHYPCIVGGDMNSVPLSPAYHVFTRTPLPVDSNNHKQFVNNTETAIARVNEWNAHTRKNTNNNSTPSLSTAYLGRLETFINQSIANGRQIYATVRSLTTSSSTKSSSSSSSASSTLVLPLLPTDQVYCRSTYAEYNRRSQNLPLTYPSALLESSFTTSTATFTACIDYLFYCTVPSSLSNNNSNTSLTSDDTLVSVVPLPTLETIRKDGVQGIPSLEEPSDHLLLGADLRDY